MALRETAFQLFKYTIYAILIFNACSFYLEEAAAARLVHPDGIEWSNLVWAYAATLDSTTWIVLLLLFELETWTLPDRFLTPQVLLLFRIMRAICYALIVYALFGYVETYLELTRWTALGPQASSLCQHTGSAFMYSLERFETITMDNCAGLGNGALFALGADAVTDSQHLQVSRWLGLADVFNASAWVLVVVVLEAEVWLLERDLLSTTVTRLILAGKTVLYVGLVAVAVFWGIYGEFIDFWDAFVWIAAFVFIENNVVQWQEEVSHEPS